MRVAGQQRTAGRRPRWAHRPVVRAARRGGQADLVANSADLLCEPQPIPVEPVTWMEHDRVALRIGRVDLGRSFLAELAHEVGPQQLPLPVGRQPEREQLASGEHVHRTPGLEFEAKQLELSRRGRGAAGRLVEAGAVRIEERSQVGVQLRLLPQGHAAETQGSHQAVNRQSRAPRDFGDPAGADAALHLDLPEAVLPMAEALAEPEVGGGPARGPPAFPSGPGRSRRAPRDRGSRSPRRYGEGGVGRGATRCLRPSWRSGRSRYRSPSRLCAAGGPRSIPMARFIPGARFPAVSRADPGRRPSSWSFSRCASMAIAAGPRSSAGTSSQTSARSAVRERSLDRGPRPAGAPASERCCDVLGDFRLRIVDLRSVTG